MAKFDLEKFSIKAPKPLPVVLLLDVSSSMTGEKINHLNRAVKEMIDSFKNETVEVEINVAMITFGGKCMVYDYQKAQEFKWQDLQTQGMTPLGECLRLAKDMIEDKEKTPSRAYRPAVVLISDGQPNDEWEEPMKSFIGSGRSSKCDRMAMAIGSDADKNMLSLFLQGTENKLFEANEATDILKFFKYVTMSVTMRSKSINPNNTIDISYEEAKFIKELGNKKDIPELDSKKNDRDDSWF